MASKRSQHRWASALALTALAVAPTAAGQPLVIFADDFEDGGLIPTDFPPGRWEAIRTNSALDSIALNPGAAHDGSRGVRSIDGSNGGDQVVTALDAPKYDGGFADRYYRAWVRYGQATDWDEVAFLIAHASDNGWFTPGSLELELPGPAYLNLTGYDRSITFNRTTAASSLDAGLWHLVEMGLVNEGTTQVQRVIWMDGVELARVTGINQMGWYPDELLIGHGWSAYGPSQGSIDFDDVAITTVPPASKLRADAGPGPLAAGACVPVNVQVRSSSGTSAPLHRAERLQVQAIAGSATIYSDPACATAGPPTLPYLASQGTFWVRASEGTMQLQVATGDLLADTLLVSVTDGGRGPAVFAVGCGCSSAPSFAALAAFALVLVRRRRAQRSAD